MLTNILMVAMIIISISLLVIILIQKKGSGLGVTLGGGGGGDAYRSRRGAEKILHYLTIALTFLFATVSFSLLFIK